jgi:general secretion pathway protein C
MQLLSFARSTRLQNFGIALLTLAATAILAVVAAYWSWEWLAPPLPGETAVAQNEPRRISSAANIFGITEQDSDSTHTTSSGTRIQLLGLLTASVNARSYAVLRIEPGLSIAVQEGEETTPGIRLAKIAIDHVIVERGGVRETLSWPSKK